MRAKQVVLFFMLFVFATYSLTVDAQKKDKVQMMKIPVQKRVASNLDGGAYMVVNEIQQWNPKETAIIICDMWNQHWCKGATGRVAEMAPVLKNLDAITDSGVEAAGLFQAKGIKNVILMGVHENMCVINRPFALRNMIRLGMNAVVMRDLTDAMYDSKEWPVVSHFTGNSLMTEYIETYIAPSIVSSVFTGQKQFRFKEDKRPVVVFVIADNEYHANQTLPQFAHDLLLTKGVNCEFALGKPEATGEGVHNIENLQILKDADLAVIFVRRRA